MFFTTYFLMALVAAFASVLALPADMTNANAALNATLAPPQQVQNGTIQPLDNQDQLLGYNNNTMGLSKCFIECIDEVGFKNMTVDEFCVKPHVEFYHCIHRPGVCLEKDIFFNFLSRLRVRTKHNKRTKAWIEKKCPKDQKALIPQLHG